MIIIDISIMITCCQPEHMAGVLLPADLPVPITVVVGKNLLMFGNWSPSPLWQLFHQIWNSSISQLPRNLFTKWSFSPLLVASEGCGLTQDAELGSKISVISSFPSMMVCYAFDHRTTSRERNSSMLTASGLLRAASNLRQDQSDNLDSKLEILKVTFYLFLLVFFNWGTSWLL